MRDRITTRRSPTSGAPRRGCSEGSPLWHSVAGRRRALRRHRLFGQPADARDRRPHGARRARADRCTSSCSAKPDAWLASALVWAWCARWPLATLMRNLLFGTPPWDVPTLAAVAVVLGASALVASYIPARRAAGVEPGRGVASRLGTRIADSTGRGSRGSPNHKEGPKPQTTRITRSRSGCPVLSVANGLITNSWVPPPHPRLRRGRAPHRSARSASRLFRDPV